MKIVICACHGGFSLSQAALHRLRAVGNAAALAEPDYGEPYRDGSGIRQAYSALGTGKGMFCDDIDRSDPQLVALVEEIGQDAAGDLAYLSIIEIPDGVEWQIEEYDGLEWVAEKHRKWS